MILAYHSIITTYGFWLPKDPRGSWSEFVGSWELFRFGRATKTETRRSVAGRPHDRAVRLAAKSALKYPPVHFDGLQARRVARGFAAATGEHNYCVHACSILPEHIHLVIARCDRSIERIVQHLKAKATSQLTSEDRHPLAGHVSRRGDTPTPWAGKAWNCFLDSRDDIARAIRYVQQNPAKEGKRPQRWSFVVPWPSDHS